MIWLLQIPGLLIAYQRESKKIIIILSFRFVCVLGGQEQKVGVNGIEKRVKK